MAYLGKTPSQAVRSRYFYTAAGGETSLSGADDNNDTLIFADGNYVDVYLNGVLLVAGSDYNVNTVNTISGLTALVASDIVEIVVYDTFAVFGGIFQGALTADSINADIFGSHQFEAKNVEGSTILKGTPVYISGHSGNDPEIGIADANDAARMPAFGIAITDIANNNKGNVIVFGNYIGLDTSSFTVGDELYVSNTGTLTATRPSGSADKVQKIAKVIRSQSQNGQIFVMGAGRSNDTPNAITTNSINLSSTTTVSGILDEDTMTSNSATSLATQQSIKAYVDSQVGANNELSEVLSNGNTTGGTDISFGDNDKAVFGAGSDLQIYHSGTQSYIDENGDGNLYIRTSGAGILLKDSTGAGSGNDMASFTVGGAANLAYNGSWKLATTATGVDVTGSVDISGSSGATLKLTSTDTTGADTELLGQIDFVSSDSSGGSAGTQARIKGVYEDNGDSSGIAFLTGNSTGSGSPTINEVMRIRHEGRVGIGTNVPSNTLSVEGSGTGLSINSTNDEVKKIVFENSGSTTGYIGSSSSSPIRFLDGSLTEVGRWDASGNLLVGTTTFNSNNVGVLAGASGALFATRDGNTPAQFNRKTSDGTIVGFQKNGTTVGAISAYAGSIIAGSGDTGIFFYDSGDVLRPVSPTTLSTRDNAIDIGSSSARFKDLYLSGGVYLGGTGSANKLDEYEEGSWTPALNGGLTPTVTQASYTLIGNRVFLNCQITVPSNSTNAAIIVSGLPYTTTENGAGSLAYTTVSTVNSMGILMQGTQIFFYKGNAYSNYLLSDFSGHTLIFTAQYNIA